jgi:hypothetical protein
MLNPGGIAPPIVEIEKRTDADGVINRFVRPAGIPDFGNVVVRTVPVLLLEFMT